MSEEAFDGDSDGLRLINGEAKMAIDTSGGGWQWWMSAFYRGDGGRFVLVFDGDGHQLWRQWTIEMAFNGSGGGGI